MSYELGDRFKMVDVMMARLRSQLIVEAASCRLINGWKPSQLSTLNSQLGEARSTLNSQLSTK